MNKKEKGGMEMPVNVKKSIQADEFVAHIQELELVSEKIRSSEKFPVLNDFILNYEGPKWVCINRVICKYKFNRALIDKKDSNPLVIYEDKLYKVIDGRYGHCGDYPRGFDILIIPVIYHRIKKAVVLWILNFLWRDEKGEHR